MDIAMFASLRDDWIAYLLDEELLEAVQAGDKARCSGRANLLTANIKVLCLEGSLHLRKWRDST